MKGFTSAIPTRTFALSLAACIGLAASAKNPPLTGGMATQTGPDLMTKAISCSPASQVTQLAFNNVRAVIENGGNMWERRAGNSRSGYEVPKTSDFSGPNAIFAGALWMGGISSTGQLKIAAVQYRQNGNDFWPGPLTTEGAATVSSEVCLEYDAFYVTSRAQAETHLQYFNCSNDPECDLEELFPDGYSIPTSFVDWPANGNPSAGQDLYLAPFVDTDGDGFYDPYVGDYPDYGFNTTVEDCKNKDRDAPVALFGDNNIYWIFNDKGDAHTETNGEPIGLEVRAQAFSFNSNDEINNMTFINYTVINQGSQTLTKTYFGHFIDPDLGCPDDDFVGCDVQRGLGFAYNWQDNDATCQGGSSIGYGQQPPAIGVDFFEGPYQDDDGVDNPGPQNTGEFIDCIIARDQKGIPYKGLGIGYGDSVIDNERFGMRAFIYFNREGNSNLTDPSNASHWYNYLQSIWKNGRPQSYGGNGYSEDPNAIRCFYMFPWNTDVVGWGTNCAVQPDWRELAPTPALPDRRFVQSAGPFTLLPGQTNNVTVGVVYARAASGGAAASVIPLRIADDKAQALFDNCFKILDGPDAPDLAIQELDRELILYLVNPVGSNNESENYVEVDPVIPESGPNGPYDRAYRFQGYKVYQLKDNTVSVSDLGNIDLARLVYQGDVKDSIGQLINYTYSDIVQQAVPTEQVNGADDGVVHAIRIADDKFAQGNPKLVNFKSYYYLAIAYGYNNYEDYNIGQGTGQSKPYVAGRKAAFGSIRSYVGIPHKPSPEAGGSIQNSSFGDLMPVTRLEGQGNGGLRLELEQSTLDAIASDPSGRVAELSYKPGSAPIAVRVVDPLAVPKAEFEVWMQDSVTPGNLNDAYWFINKINGDEVVTVYSDRTIDLNYEQLLLDWGISVSIGQTFYYSTAQGPEFLATAPIGSGTMTFADDSKPWLMGIPDGEGINNAQNWILSGLTTDTDFPIYSDRANKDNNQIYENILGGTWAPWTLVGIDDFQPGRAGSLGSSTQTPSKIAETPSVQVIITSDKSKWSRCMVVEEEANTTLSIGGAQKLSLRKSPSVDKEGRMSGTPGCNEAEATMNGTQPTGAGWFPGYAVELETGERLNISFGENSFWGGAIGQDMLWNPGTDILTSAGDPTFGGSHWIYVFKNDRRLTGNQGRVPSYDEAQFMYGLASSGGTADLINLYRGVAWVGSAIRNASFPHLATDVNIVLNVAKPYTSFTQYPGAVGSPIQTPLNNGLPLYKFGSGNYAVTTRDDETANATLDIIGIVPNPYYGFSGYETTRLDNRVKFINLPEECTISIYNVGGTLVRKFKKSNDLTYLDWDLKNSTNIPIAGGVYICHVEVPGVGETVLKWFGALRPLDLQNF